MGGTRTNFKDGFYLPGSYFAVTYCSTLSRTHEDRGLEALALWFDLMALRARGTRTLFWGWARYTQVEWVHRHDVGTYEGGLRRDVERRWTQDQDIMAFVMIRPEGTTHKYLGMMIGIRWESLSSNNVQYLRRIISFPLHKLYQLITEVMSRSPCVYHCSSCFE